MKAKKSIFSVLKNTEFSLNTLYSVIVGAENIVNSRPLCYQTSDPNEQRVLTPNMFLHGRMDGFAMPSTVDTTDFNPRLRWRLVQQALSHIWKRYLKEILPTLGPRQKWTTDNRNYEIGDEVLCMDPSLPRYKWIIGRVTNVYPGRDGVVRTLDVRTENGEMRKKTVQRLIPLT